MTAAALASGGLDSAALIAHLGAVGAVQPIYIRAGLAWEDEEFSALGAVCAALAGGGVPVRGPAELSAGGGIYEGHWSAAGGAPDYGAPDEDVFIPARNLVLIGLAAAWCAVRGIDHVAIGTLAGNPFADAGPGFLERYAALISEAVGRPMTVTAPFSRMSKAQLIARYGHLPFHLTLTCMAPRDGIHCGACNKCRERHEAFREAGVTDGARFAVPAAGMR